MNTTYAIVEKAFPRTVHADTDTERRTFWLRSATCGAVVVIIMSVLFSYHLSLANQSTIDHLQARLAQLELRVEDVTYAVSSATVADLDAEESSDLSGSSSPADLGSVSSAVSSDFAGSVRLGGNGGAVILPRVRREAEEPGRRKGKRNDGNRKEGKRGRKNRNKRRNKKGKNSDNGNERNCSNSCPLESSLPSTHFEAYVPINYTALNEHGSVSISEGDGILTKEGFLPNHRTFKFWRGVGFNSSLLPDFMHISPSGNHYTILQNGIYYIYAQILFHDLTGRWAFGIYADDEILAQCTTAQQIPVSYIESIGGHNPSHGVYSHCYTGLATRVLDRQRISIRSLYDGRVVVALGKSTFWGIIKLSSEKNS